MLIVAAWVVTGYEIAPGMIAHVIGLFVLGWYSR
jgi:hypothetical protein